MTKNYRLKNLGCANCAAKMERDISKLAGVQSAQISFMTTKMTIEADEADFDRIYKEAEEIIHRYEPEVAVTRA